MATASNKKQEVLNSYVELARKLNKMPTVVECKRFGLSEKTIVHHWGNLKSLKAGVLEQFPDLADMTMPAQLNAKDVESYRIGLETSKRNKQNKKTVLASSSLDYLAQFAENVFAGKVTPNRTQKSKAKSNRALNLTLSDLHFGADIKAEETGFLSYGVQEEARRFAKIIQQTIDYKQGYRKETELHVNLLGDIIQHKLHDPQDAAPMSEQVCRAIHLLTQGIALLAEHFPKVTVHCATGNHGRDLNRHRERATSGKWDSIETVIYYAVQQSLKNYKNLVFDIPKTPFVIYEVFGNKVFATHGDNVLSPGNPGKALQIGKLESQLNRINASLKDNEEVKVAIVGHTHVASISHLSTGAVMITNGALPPADQFAVSIGILENRASQTIFEMTPDYPVGDIRFVMVNERDDADSTLNELIVPWKNF